MSQSPCGIKTRSQQVLLIWIICPMFHVGVRWPIWSEGLNEFVAWVCQKIMACLRLLKFSGDIQPEGHSWPWQSSDGDHASIDVPPHHTFHLQHCTVDDVFVVFCSARTEEGIHRQEGTKTLISQSTGMFLVWSDIVESTRFRQFCIDVSVMLTLLICCLLALNTYLPWWQKPNPPEPILDVQPVHNIKLA